MSISITDVVEALCFILPAYCANATPVLLGGGSPIDGGRIFWDGKPLLGSSKTIRGFFAGLAVGTLVGIVQKTPLLGFSLSLGALIGDLVHSFFKRRLGMPPGSPFPVADQLDFVIGALFFSLLISQPNLLTFVIVLVVTPPIHLLTNLLAYLFNFKKTPW